MITIHFPGGTAKTVPAPEGIPLSFLLGPDHPDMPCAGAGRCGKCRVAVRGSVSEPSEIEKRLLGEDLEKGIRLACQTFVTGSADIFLSGDSKVMEIREDGVSPSFTPDPVFRNTGAAVDIGTTTLAAGLYDRTGKLLARTAEPNPQRVYGADVVSRIGKSLAGERHALAESVRTAVCRMLVSLAETAGMEPEAIDAVVITGNTAMLYLLTERNPDCLAHAPFLADELFGRYARPEEVFFPELPGAKIYLPRCMSAYVGADITTALLASGICSGGDMAMLADIGTNGEIALWDGKRLLCCSTAAGPVFEGAEISRGMQGRAGAIDHVRLEDGKIICHVIGGGSPLGICGSGILDAVSVMCEQGIVDETGYMETEAFSLTKEVSVTRKDIRMVQLAKSAVCAGIRTLLSEAGVRAEQLKTLGVAGGFGSFLNLDSAARIGLIPAELREKGTVLGNAALSGASMMLLKKDYIEEGERIAALSRTVDLGTNPAFAELFIECMEL